MIILGLAVFFVICGLGFFMEDFLKVGIIMFSIGALCILLFFIGVLLPYSKVESDVAYNKILQDNKGKYYLILKNYDKIYLSEIEIVQGDSKVIKVENKPTVPLIQLGSKYYKAMVNLNDVEVIYEGKKEE